MPATVGGNHRRDELESGVRRRPAPVVRRKPPSPSLLDKGAIGAASPDLSGVVEPRWMRHVDLEVREREREALGTNIRPVRKSRVFLLRLRPKPQPPEHCFQLVTQVPVTTRPGAGVSGARVRMVTLRIVPAAPPRAASRATVTATTALRLERHVEAEPHQRRVFSVEEGQTVLRRRNCKPNAGPNSSAILYPGPILRRSNPVEALPSLPVHGEGKDALLFA